MSKNIEVDRGVIDDVAYTSYQWNLDDEPFVHKVAAHIEQPAMIEMISTTSKEEQSQHLQESVNQMKEEMTRMSERLAKSEEEKEQIRQLEDRKAIELAKQLYKILQEQRTTHVDENSINAMQLRSGRILQEPEKVTKEADMQEEQEKEEKQEDQSPTV